MILIEYALHVMRFNLGMHLLHQWFHFVDALVILVLEAKKVSGFQVAIITLSTFVFSFFFGFHGLDSLHSLGGLLLLQLNFSKLLFGQEVLRSVDVPFEFGSAVSLQHVVVVESAELKCFLCALELLLVEPLRRAKRAHSIRGLLSNLGLLRIFLILLDMMKHHALRYFCLLLLQGKVTWPIPIFESLF